MTKYETNKSKLPDLDKFETARNSILRDMHRNAKRYHLTDKQVAFAKRLWDEEQNGNSVYADNLLVLVKSFHTLWDISKWYGLCHIDMAC